MATTMERPAPARPTAREAAPSLRPSAKARGRLAAGVLLGVLGVLVNLAVYRGLNDKTPVLRLARDVPAGQQVVADDFTTVKIAADGGFRAVPAGDVNSVVGSYAKVRLVAGTLLAAESLQPDPLVASGSAVVAVTVGSGELPVGLRERSRVRLVLTAGMTGGVVDPVEGVTVGLPVTPVGGAGNQVSVSVEVPSGDANRVAAAERVRLVLLDPQASQP